MSRRMEELLAKRKRDLNLSKAMGD